MVGLCSPHAQVLFVLHGFGRRVWEQGSGFGFWELGWPLSDTRLAWEEGDKGHLSSNLETELFLQQNSIRS